MIRTFLDKACARIFACETLTVSVERLLASDWRLSVGLMSETFLTTQISSYRPQSWKTPSDHCRSSLPTFSHLTGERM